MMRAYRSPIRLFAFGTVGIALIVVAIDVLFGHWISTPPENTEGVLTTRGHAQQRGDIVWGAAMLGAGTLLVGGAVVELVRRKPLIAIGADGIVLAIGSHERDVLVRWSVIEDATSDTIVDPYDGSVREVLVIGVNDPAGLPRDPIGAIWEGDTLVVDGHDWTRSVTDVALTAQGAIGHHRRVEEIRKMGPPSLVWEMTVDGETTPELGGVATGTTTHDEPHSEEGTTDRPPETMEDGLTTTANEHPVAGRDESGDAT